MMAGTAVAAAVGVSVGPSAGVIVASGTPAVGETMAVCVATGAVAGAGVAVPVPPHAAATATPTPQKMIRKEGTAAIIPGNSPYQPESGYPS